ncbi:hypothetical protein C1646_760567 [Rhizophagus diaphanus]|nr:hypothetical protein C1646_760567 [Rhizophagus diaphanus] [Rhizophagus sp. MUCL 43196]
MINDPMIKNDLIVTNITHDPIITNNSKITNNLMISDDSKVTNDPMIIDDSKERGWFKRALKKPSSDSIFNL